MARFFIERPIFAWVISIIVMGIGILSVLTLPIAQYPQIAPPSISIRATYPGASAQTVANTVTQIIEQQMTGLDGMRYVSSNSTSAGTASITLTFETGTDPDIAQVQVQNKLAQATPLLPDSVQRQGVTVQKSSAGFLMVIALISPDGSLDQTDLSDYLKSNLVDEMSRIEGVGSVQVFGGQYAMRIWLDPSKLTAYELTPSDVVAAVSAENAQISAGAFGDRPTADGQMLNATITAQSLLQTPEDFRQIVLRAQENGGLVLLDDVATVEIGSEGYNFTPTYDGQPASGMAISLAPGANALDTSELVHARMEEFAQFFPAGIAYTIPYDTTPFVEISIEEVLRTLVEAIILVFLVMLLFLQNVRATIIPTLAVPVVILGTFAILAMAGFTI
ncbi:MAG: efflux RND transporter permease subunit, partial [Sagittula sp.]